MKSFLVSKFAKDESGAVTVDWVVLTAAVVGMAGAIIFAIHDGSESVGENTQNYLNSIEVANVGE